MIYLIGSLRNPEVPKVANKLREAGFDVFDDWYAAGPEADDKWRDYEKGRGRSYLEALHGAAANNVFQFDRRHIDSSDAVILILPAGKSGHLELGYSLGRGKQGYILLDDPERWDVMYKFATKVSYNLEEIIGDLDERRKVGSVLFGDGAVCQHCFKRPIDKDWCRYCGKQQQCHICGFQWVPSGDGG